MPPMSRIEVTAILKSVAEAGMPPENWSGAVAVAQGILDKFGGSLDAAPPPATRAQPAKPASAEGQRATATLTLETHPEIKQSQRGTMARVEAAGYAPGKWFSAFGKNADDIQRLGPGERFTCTIIHKPNPGKRDHLNLEDIAAAPPW